MWPPGRRSSYLCGPGASEGRGFTPRRLGVVTRGAALREMSVATIWPLGAPSSTAGMQLPGACSMSSAVTSRLIGVFKILSLQRQRMGWNHAEGIKHAAGVHTANSVYLSLSSGFETSFPNVTFIVYLVFIFQLDNHPQYFCKLLNVSPRISPTPFDSFLNKDTLPCVFTLNTSFKNVEPK